jgi:hypothetical protein
MYCSIPIIINTFIIVVAERLILLIGYVQLSKTKSWALRLEFIINHDRRKRRGGQRCLNPLRNITNKK